MFTEQGEALFTHFGLSGPLVLSASTYIEDIAKHRYICEFDLKPALDEKTLYDRLTRDFAEQGAHSVQGALAKLLPNSMRPVAVEKWGVDPATRAAQITKEQTRDGLGEINLPARQNGSSIMPGKGDIGHPRRAYRNERDGLDNLPFEP